MGTGMEHNALLRLLHLVSPSLPTGAFSYSQGLEWAVEAGWVRDSSGLYDWITNLHEQTLPYVDIALLSRMYRAVEAEDELQLENCCALHLSCRESFELRQEELTRGRALATLLTSLNLPGAHRYQHIICRSQLAGFALAAQVWAIPLAEAALGYTWAWLENQVLAGVKIIPLGQTEGQRLLMRLGEQVAGVVELGLKVEDHQVGASTPALAIGSSLHETQYSRLYRS